MFGPEDSPYKGGIFTIKIIFPENYPKYGPEFKFLNKIYHLNVDLQQDLGHISLSSLNGWRISGIVPGKKIYGVKQALFDIFFLFYKQGIDSSYDEVMAQQYEYNRKKFDEIAKKWTNDYAKLTFEK